MERETYTAIACVCLLATGGLSAQKPQAKDSVAFHIPDTLLLDEVTVTAPALPIEQRGDTVIFNPGAFKVPEGAYLEALVRRIPGLNYDPKTHSLSYNGCPIQEITVNGKEFFKGNKRIALENVPASFVSRLKVYDKETEEEKDTGIKDAEKNYVLDLQTKKKLNGTLAASVEAGYGNRRKRDIDGQMFRFEDGGDNLSITGRSGNRDFTAPDERNIARSIAANASRHINEKLEMSGSISYSYDRNGSTASGYNENYLTETTQYGVNTNNSLTKNQNIGGNLHIGWDIDGMTRLSVTGNARRLPSSSWNGTHSATFSANPQADLKDPFARLETTSEETRINDQLRQTQDKNVLWGYDINARLTRKLSPKGHNLSLSYSASRNAADNESSISAEAVYFRLKDAWGNDSVSRQRQYRKSPNGTLSHEAELAYTHAFNEKLRLQLAYAFKREHEENSQDTYDIPPASEGFPASGLPHDGKPSRIDSLSNRSESSAVSHRISLTCNYRGKVWNLQARLSVTPQRRSLRQEETGARIDTSSSCIEWYPSVAVTRQKNNWYAMLSYSGYTSQPSLANLLAPAKYISPLLVIRSNPGLRPSYSHSVHLSVNNFSKGVNAAIAFSQDFNNVTQASTYDSETGRQETRPINVNGNWSTSGNAGYNKSIGLFRLFANASTYYARRTGLLNDGSATKRSLTRALALSSDIRISYLPSWGNIDIDGKWDYRQSKNSLQGNNAYTRNYIIGVTANVQLPLSLTFDTDAAYSIRSGTAMQGDGDNEMLWNIRLGWKFLKEKRAELSFRWTDILSQRKSYSRYASPVRFSEIYSEQLRGYFMVSLKYQFNKIN